MTDLVTTLPRFSTQPFSHLLPSLEKACITTTDLLTLNAQEVARRANVPLLDLRSLVKAVVEALHFDLGLLEPRDRPDGATESTSNGCNFGKDRRTGQELVEAWSVISTLEPAFDTALAGGIPTGYITEITGERCVILVPLLKFTLTFQYSGAGKTQFLLTLLLSVQLPQSLGGLSAPAIYISTEHPLPTTRLRSLLSSHPSLSSLSEVEALNNILSLSVPDLESQDHILTYQLPIAVRRHGARLVVLDSVAANYRAEFENNPAGTTSSKASKPLGLTERTAALNTLGRLLRNLARDEDCAVVVANQVADRFGPVPFSAALPAPPPPSTSTSVPRPFPNSFSSSPAAQRSSQPFPSSSASVASERIPLLPTRLTRDVLSYDYQLNFFSGWCAPSPFAMTFPSQAAEAAGSSNLPSTQKPQSTQQAQTQIQTMTQTPSQIPNLNSNLSSNMNLNLKTPSLGLTWSSIIACRIVLTKSPRRRVYNSNGSVRQEQSHRRFKIAFAAWCEGTVDEVYGGQGGGADGVEFEIWAGGVRAVDSSSSSAAPLGL